MIGFDSVQGLDEDEPPVKSGAKYKMDFRLRGNDRRMDSCLRRNDRKGGDGSRPGR